MHTHQQGYVAGKRQMIILINHMSNAVVNNSGNTTSLFCSIYPAGVLGIYYKLFYNKTSDLISSNVKPISVSCIHSSPHEEWDLSLTGRV